MAGEQGGNGKGREGAAWLDDDDDAGRESGWTKTQRWGCGEAALRYSPRTDNARTEISSEKGMVFMHDGGSF